MIDLLSPVGNFECLKAAVQNGADSVYFGSNIFSARAFAHNFNLDELRKAIHYAKIRGVKTNLTLNTLIKDTEFDNAFMLAKKAYEFGIDAIIVQDLGLAKELIEKFPDLAIHASTQMTVHNLSGALELQDIGFKRIVLARELSLNEIDYICKNTNVEIECFIHGALCISYSGQCLFSSMIGRKVTEIAANALGPCRLPYELYENNKKINSGYILSTRDLCGLDYIPNLIESGVKCLKIEGRMKSAEYVATVTRIYRKYIDLALSNNEYIVDEKDRLELMQVYNRGMSSYGHLENTPNKNLVFKEKPNNMGLYLGKIQHFNKSKGLITLKLKTPVEIGDTISIENEKGTYTISELMENNKNITTTKQGQLVTIGRMKGNISVKNKVYKMSSKSLLQSAKESYKYENKKMFLNCKVTIKKDLPISIRITPANGIAIYKNLNVTYEMEDIPLPAKTKPLTKDIIINQISKTTSTPFEFKKIVVDLDDNLFLPKISTLNELRRKALEQVENYAIAHIERSYNEPQTASETNETLNTMRNYISQQPLMQKKPKIKTSLLLNMLNTDFDYSKLNDVDNIYIPLKFFTNKKFSNILQTLSEKSKIYIYMPTIIKGNYKNLFYSYAEKTVKNHDIRGFVVSNIGNIKLLNDLFEDLDKYFKIVANYTFNIFNSNTILELKKLGISKFTFSPELNRETIANLSNYRYLQRELIVYGRTPLINMNYCLLRRI